MSHARAGLGSQMAQPHALFGPCLNMAWQQSHQLGEAEVLFWALLATAMRERLCESSWTLRQEWRCHVELCMLRWAGLQGQALCFWTCTHPVFTQTFHVDLENAIAAEHILHSHSLVTEGSTN